MDYALVLGAAAAMESSLRTLISKKDEEGLCNEAFVYNTSMGPNPFV